MLLDVDGVINDLGSLRGKHRNFEVYSVEAGGFTLHIPGYMPDLIGRLCLAAEVMWLTTWEHQANQHIAPLLGIDPLPVVELDPITRLKPSVARPHLWRAHGAGRKSFWIEDFVKLPRGMPDTTTLLDTTPNGVLLAEDLGRTPDG